VAQKAARVRDLHAAEVKGPPVDQPMDIGTVPDAQRHLPLL
jgi:hypothetical protein